MRHQPPTMWHQPPTLVPRHQHLPHYQQQWHHRQRGHRHIAPVERASHAVKVVD
jgi:hypothetical protein